MGASVAKAADTHTLDTNMTQHAVSRKLQAELLASLCDNVLAQLYIDSLLPDVSSEELTASPSFYIGGMQWLQICLAEESPSHC